MAQCSGCGRQLADGVKFCPGCGAGQETAPAPVVSAPVPTSTSSAAPRRSRLPFILLAVVLVLALAGSTAAFVLYKGGAFDSESPDVEVSIDTTDVTLQDGTATLLLTVSAEDDFALDRIEVEVNGKQVKVVKADGKQQFDQDIELPMKKAGEFVVRVAAIDRKGNDAAAKRMKVTVREPAPAPTPESFDQNPGQLPSGHPSIGGTASPNRVESGISPRQHVERYFQALVDQDWALAYSLMPADKQAATTEEQYAEQVKAYGVTGYKITDDQEDAGRAVVTASMTTSAGDFGYKWTFERTDGDWFVLSREITGIGQ